MATKKHSFVVGMIYIFYGILTFNDIINMSYPVDWGNYWNLKQNLA